MGDLINHLGEVARAEEYLQAPSTPTAVTSIVSPFKNEGRKASLKGATITQFKALPAVIAPQASIIIGIPICIESGSNWLSGADVRGDQITLSIKRVE